MNIEYYEKPNGRCPVQEFIRDLPAMERVRVMNAIERLQEYGLELERPHVATLRDDIRELRVKTQHGQYRVLHFIAYRDTAVLLHAITKKSDKVPDAAIDKAIEYKTDYENQHRQARTLP
ncbi:MAG: hypothetical protein BWY25_00586 [Chloroflexi bacterium ADurb.Bin222]|nr:MAG: hypothetical protein BWY25_00586 [Chloroflexi bacterium ADurb.Bin222]